MTPDFLQTKTERRRSISLPPNSPRWNIAANRRYPGWTAVSRSARILCSQLDDLALSSKPLLLIGEPGTGKRTLAQLIHNNGPNPEAPFYEPDDRPYFATHPAGPESTGDPDKSNLSGSIYVSEWTNLPQERQKQLITGPHRLIAAIRPGEDSIEEVRNLWKKQSSKAQVLSIPPLRERKADIPVLAGSILGSLSFGRRSPCPPLTPAAVAALKSYPWPGNIPELKEAIRRSLEFMEAAGNTEGPLTADCLPPEIRGAGILTGSLSFPESMVSLEQAVLKTELTRQRGNVTRTARVLGLTPRQVGWRVRKYGINPRDFKIKHLADE